jgi:hypothetical protein
MRTHLIGAAIAATALGGFTTSAQAAVTVCQSAGCVQPSSNVLFNTSTVGNPVTGGLNNNPALVTFTSNESLTTTQSNGQARISATDGMLNVLSFGLASGATFSEVEFNLNALTDGIATISFLGAGGSVLSTGSYAISANGQNFFDALGGAFTSVTISSTAALSDVRQIRLGGIAAASAVPEPATWALMLMGFGAVGFSMRRRRATARPMMQMA